MPSLFDKKPEHREEPREPDIVKIINSELSCDDCWVVNTDGDYFPEQKLLIWDCMSCGHHNEVRNIEL